jgi:hypothetical protein
MQLVTLSLGFLVRHEYLCHSISGDISAQTLEWLQVYSRWTCNLVTLVSNKVCPIPCLATDRAFLLLLEKVLYAGKRSQLRFGRHWALRKTHLHLLYRTSRISITEGSDARAGFYDPSLIHTYYTEQYRQCESCVRFEGFSSGHYEEWRILGCGSV